MANKALVVLLQPGASLTGLCRVAVRSEGFGPGLGDSKAASRCFCLCLPEPHREELRSDGAIGRGHLLDRTQPPAQSHSAGQQERICTPTTALEHQQEAR